MGVIVGRAPLLLLLLAGLLQLAAGQASCRVSYSSSTKLPLLFGGVNQGCQGLRCQSRLGPLGAKCGARDGSSWGVCTADQATFALNFARKTLGAAATSLSPCELMRYLQGRTMWLLGDSHTKTLWSALQCFLIDMWDHNVCAPSADEAAVEELAALPKVPGNANCMHLLGPAGGRVCMVEVVLGSSLFNASLPGGGVIPLLRKKFATPQDIFVVQFGAWHRKNLADMATYEPSLIALGEDHQANKGWPHLLFRETSAAHPKDVDARVCTPNIGYSLVEGTRLLSTPAADADDQAKYVMGRPLSEIANSLLPKFGVSIVPSFNITTPLHNQHIEMRHVDALDCLHYCAPGVPQMWIWQLYSALASGQGGVTPLQPVARVPGGFGGGSTVVEERGAGRGGQQQQQQQRGGRLLELLRLGRRRLLQGDDAADAPASLRAAPGSGRQLLAATQRLQCVRPKVIF